MEKFWLGEADVGFDLNNGYPEEWNTFLQVLCKQESNNNPNAEGDIRNGRPQALGILQLWDIYVQDVNRMYPKRNFFHSDALNPKKAALITTLYLMGYGRNYAKKTGKQPTYEVLARIHNGGPNGWQKDATIRYWESVKKIFEEMT
jgi:hypothetical protein